jgi:UDP-perosamine 4-acetyltransferase
LAEISTSARVVVVGGGGHAHVVIEALQEQSDIEVVGFLDPRDEVREILGVPRLGSDDLLPDLARQGVTGAVAGNGSNMVRAMLFELILRAGLTPVTVIHPTATISRSAVIGRGVVILPHAVIHTQAQIGDNTIINTGATIDHHDRIGRHVHVAPGCHLAGNVSVGDFAMLGIGATVVPDITIGARVFVSAGLTVTRDIPEGTRYSRRVLAMEGHASA